jgi:parallel beta-helix repeat protein
MTRHCWFRLLKRHVRSSKRAPIRTALLRLEALENRTVPTTLVVSPGGIVPGSFSSVQAAVNAAANSGDTILVDPGAYLEQVTITKSLTIQGNGAGATIQALPTLTTADTFGLHVLVEIGNAVTVNMSNLTVQGPSTNINAGILVVGGATLNVTGTTVAHIHQNASTFGLQTGGGIQVGGTGSQAVGQVGHATITDCTVTDYQKVGIIIGRSGSSGTITGCTITGVGPTPLTAQNGIQIGPGTAAGAAVSNNTISGNQFTGTGSGPDPFTTTQAAGILNFIDSCSITGNTVSSNDIGIFSTNSGGTSAGTTISGNTLQDHFEGILLGAGTATVSNNTITGNNLGVAVIAFAGDTTNAVGTLVSNNITDNGKGGLAFPGAGILVANDTGATTTAQATAHFNRIVGNSVGLDNTTTATVDATNNWWGSNAGPGGAGSDTVSGPATFNPWLLLQVTAAPTAVAEGGVATVVADLTHNNAGTNTSALGQLPDGIPVAFGAAGTGAGTIVPATGFTVSGKAAAQFTAGNTAGTATVSATVDNQTSTATVTVTAVPHTTVGVFDPTTATWYLRNSNSPGAPNFTPFAYGGANWIGVVGDWNGDGVTTIGVVDPSTMTWYLRNENSPGAPDITPFKYGQPGDIPVVGDWNGDGIDTIGVARPNTTTNVLTWYLRNENSPGAPDIPPFAYGAAGWVPVVGDWNGAGVTTVGAFDPIGQFGKPPATWYLNLRNESGGGAGAVDIAPFAFGAAGWKPVVGDWDGNGTTTVGVFDPVGQFGKPPATWYLRNENSSGNPDIAPFSYGAGSWTPVAGDWIDPPLPLHALGGGVLGGPAVNMLTQDTADALEAQALARLQQDGVSAAVVSRLAAVDVEVGGLVRGEVATADPQSGRVLLDASAAGHGWFVDPTPQQDEEFVAGAAGQPQAAVPGGPADGRVDLLTALVQELGVAAGLDGAILTSALAPGTRNVAALDAFYATL